jgi:hypothetical protein
MTRTFTHGVVPTVTTVTDQPKFKLAGDGERQDNRFSAKQQIIVLSTDSILKHLQRS